MRQVMKKLKEYFEEVKYRTGNSILSLSICEQASKRNDCEISIKHLSDPLIEHFIKIYHWDDPVNLGHHYRAINTWLGKIYRTYRVANNKRPTPDMYYNWLFKDQFQNINDLNMLIKSMDEYHGLPILNDIKTTYQLIDTIIRKISTDMGHNKFESLYDYVQRVE